MAASTVAKRAAMKADTQDGLMAGTRVVKTAVMRVEYSAETMDEKMVETMAAKMVAKMVLLEAEYSVGT